jgi:cysteine desulfurase/selenocysteine lyase
VQRFINAPDVNEVICARHHRATIWWRSWARSTSARATKSSSRLEHHANIVPWQQLAAAKGAKLRVFRSTTAARSCSTNTASCSTTAPKLVAITQVSNALGTVTPVKEVVALAHSVGAKALVDGAQSVSHMRIDVGSRRRLLRVLRPQSVRPDRHRRLWGKRAVLEDMPPWQGGGNMIADVTFEKPCTSRSQQVRSRHRQYADAVGLGAAIDYVNRIGIDNIARYEHELLVYGTAQLKQIKGVRLIGTADKASVMSFVLDGYTTEQVGKALNEEGIAVTHPPLRATDPAPLRRRNHRTASLAFYNTYDEIDRWPPSSASRLKSGVRSGNPTTRP